MIGCGAFKNVDSDGPQQDAAYLACMKGPYVKVAGAPADWTHRGDFEGYSVTEGCRHGEPDVRHLVGWAPIEEPDVLIIGKGAGWFGGVEPCPPELGECRYTGDNVNRESHQRRRSGALSKPGGLPYPRVPSNMGITSSTACTSKGMYLEIVIADWKDVNSAAQFVGEYLREHDLKERVGIHLAPERCAHQENE